MPRKAELPQSRRHILVFDEDWEFLEQAYGPTSASRFGVGPAIRQIVHAKVRQLKEQVNQLRDARQAQSDLQSAVQEPPV